MLKKPKWLRFTILSGLLISACATSPPDVYVFEHFPQRLETDPLNGHLMLTPSPSCMKMIGEVECGHGVSIKSGKEIFVGENETNLFNNKPWSRLRAQSVYIPAKESYAPLATYIIDSCKKMHCDDQVSAFRVKLNSLNGIAGAIAPVLP